MSRHYINPLDHETTFSTPLQAMYWNGVYYPNWRIYRDQPPVSLNYDVISHVFYAFAWVKDDGTVYLSDEWADAQIDVPGADDIPATKGCLNSFALLKKKYTRLRVVLSVGGGGKGSEPFAAVARDPACRERFAQSSLGLVQQFGIDGIDNASQGQDYIALLAILRQYLPAPQYTLSSALPAGEWALQHINLAHAAHYLDMINLMAYDYSGPWVSKCGHQAQLFTPHIPHSPEASISCHSAVSYMLHQGVPRNKIVMGVPAYGRSFTGTNGIGHPFAGQAGEEGTFEYRDLPRPGSEEHVDNQLGAAYCIGGDGGLVTYDNPHTVRMKANYVRQNGLGGLFYWTGTGDASSLTQKDRSLVYNGFLGLFPHAMKLGPFLSRVMDSALTLNAAEYDPIDHLNAIFSHPATLSSVSATADALRSYQDDLDEDIAGFVASQSSSDADSVQRIQAAKAELADLFKKIESVRERAMQTEQTITEMTADIKRLDSTKKNLTLSMTALKRLQMLTTAYEQLRSLSKARQYGECAQLLQAVLQLVTHFKSYRSIDQIATLSRNVADVQGELLEQVCEDFEVTFAKGETAQRKAMLAEACLVIDALGEHARTRLINWYCNTQLREYRQVFRGNDEAGSLDNIGRRYSWFNRMMKTYDVEHASIFPASWRVNEMLANSFCEGTREDFKSILQKSSRTTIRQRSLVPKYRQQPLRNPEEEFSHQAVIPSSTELFSFYRLTLAQCAKLSTGTRLQELSVTFAKYLDQYGQQVLYYFLSEKSGAQGPSIEDAILILNTADYCYMTCNQLEEKIRGRIDEEFKEKVDLQSQADAFMGIASATVRILVRKVEIACEPSWREMRNTPWAKLESVGDQSTYIAELLRHVKERSGEILKYLHKQQYARAFCDNLVDQMASTYIANIVQCKPISEVGAEQMLLDSYVLKKGFTELPTLNEEAGTAPPASAALPPEALVQAYLIHIADKSDTNFRKILELKGIRKADQMQLLDLFAAFRASPNHENLVQNSPFLTPLQIQTVGGGIGAGSVGGGGTPSLGGGRFDAAGLGNMLVNAARDGVDRFGSPAPGGGGAGVSIRRVGVWMGVGRRIWRVI
ncbi:hypothetical protein CFE70_001302 [Pyrenophora teres f. teres 0-1]